jgi:hypothetical protein
MKVTRLAAVASGVLLACMMAGTALAQGFQPSLGSEPTPEKGLFHGGPTAALTSSRQDPGATSAQEPIPPGQALDQPYIVDGGTGELYNDFWGCCQSCCEAGLYGGVEATFLAAVGEPEQTVTLTDLTTGSTFSESSEPGLGAGIRTWLGIQCNGWGFRATYWHFEEDTVDAIPTIPVAVGPNFIKAFHLNIDTIDVECTQKMCCGCWRIYTSCGGRWVDAERASSVVGFGNIGGVDLFGLAAGGWEMDGAGFTFAIGGVRPIACHCGWSWYWNYRGSFLSADIEVAAFTQAAALTGVAFGGGAAASTDVAFASEQETVFINEIQWGIQYEHCCCCVPATVFFRTGLELQHWDLGDAFARTGSFAFLAGGPPLFGGRVDASSDAHDGDLTLVGFTIGGGICY